MPSLMVPGGTTTDFFFSGHEGFCLIAVLEFSRHKWFIFKYCSLVVLFFQAFVMIALRGHYTIDLISGLIIGHWCYIVSRPIDEYIIAKIGRAKKPNPLEVPLLLK